jgi:hypothetical protein
VTARPVADDTFRECSPSTAPVFRLAVLMTGNAHVAEGHGRGVCPGAAQVASRRRDRRVVVPPPGRGQRDPVAHRRREQRPGRWLDGAARRTRIDTDRLRSPSRCSPLTVTRTPAGRGGARYHDDLSEADVAGTLGMAPGSVKSHASRGLAQLRTLLDQQEESR